MNITTPDRHCREIQARRSRIRGKVHKAEKLPVHRNMSAASLCERPRLLGTDRRFLTACRPLVLLFPVARVCVQGKADPIP